MEKVTLALSTSYIWWISVGDQFDQLRLPLVWYPILDLASAEHNVQNVVGRSLASLCCQRARRVAPLRRAFRPNHQSWRYLSIYDSNGWPHCCTSRMDSRIDTASSAFPASDASWARQSSWQYFDGDWRVLWMIPCIELTMRPDTILYLGKQTCRSQLVEALRTWSNEPFATWCHASMVATS